MLNGPGVGAGALARMRRDGRSEPDFWWGLRYARCLPGPCCIAEDTARGPGTSTATSLTRWPAGRLTRAPRLMQRQVLDRAAEGSFAKVDVVELCGPAGSGKTEFLYAAAISNVLQSPNRHVVYLDLDYKFEPYRVSYLLQHRLQGEGVGQDGNARDENEAQPQDSLANAEEDRRRRREKVNETFERLHVFSCSSSLQFLATLKVLATDFVPSLYDRGGMLGAIVVDNVSAYWDVLQELKSKHVGASRASKSRGGVEQPSFVEAIVHSLIELRNMCDVPIILSRRVPREEFHDVGNRQWNDFVVKRASLGCTLSRCQGGTLGRGGDRRDGDPRGQRPEPADTRELERTIRWVKGERGSTTFVVHASRGIM